MQNLFQKGYSPILLILVASLGILAFIFASSILPFKPDTLFSMLYPKIPSYAATTQTIALNPVADTYLFDVMKSANYGGEKKLVIDGHPGVAYSYFKYDLSLLTGKEIVGVSFKFKTSSEQNAPSQDSIKIRLVNNTSWDEYTLNFRNRPSLSAFTLGTITGVNAPDKWYTIALNSSQFVQKIGGLISFAIKSQATDDLLISSKESGTPPQLIVYYNDLTQLPVPSEQATSSCQPRPACLDAEPACLRNEPIDGWCSTIWKPDLNTSWQWQLTGLPVDQTVDAQVFDIDLYDNDKSVIDSLHAKGKKVICYYSAGSWEEWRGDAASFPASVIGNSLDGWPGEKWLDIRRVDLLGPIMQVRLDLAKAKGCDGVEPDNVDSYTHSTGFPLSFDDQLNYNKWTAEQAHLRGLSVGLKNDINQIPQLLGEYDWALNESCHVYDECSYYQQFVSAGKAVFNAEYILSTSQFCPQSNALNINSIKKNWDLDVFREACR